MRKGSWQDRLAKAKKKREKERERLRRKGGGSYHVQVLRVFGHWVDARVQGTERTFRFYAYHPLDRVLSLGLALAVWAGVFLFGFCRSGRPGQIGIYYHGLGTFYPKGWRFFLIWMATAVVPFTLSHWAQYRWQRRILRGELVARRGMLRQAGYIRYATKGGMVTKHRIAVEVTERSRVSREVYEVKGDVFKKFWEEDNNRACRVELIYLPPGGPEKRDGVWGLPANCVDRLHIRLEEIVPVEYTSGRCRLVEGELFGAKKKKTKK